MVSVMLKHLLTWVLVRFTVLTKIHEIHYVEVESCMRSYHVEAKLNQDCTGSESCVCAHVCTYEL